MGASTNWQESLLTQVININTAGDNIVISAPPAGCYLAIDFLQLIPTLAVTVQFYSGPSTTTPLSGPYPLTAQQVITDENVFQNQSGVFTCKSAQSFNINLGAGVQCGGFIRYRIVGNN